MTKRGGREWKLASQFHHVDRQAWLAETSCPARATTAMAARPWHEPAKASALLPSSRSANIGMSTLEVGGPQAKTDSRGIIMMMLTLLRAVMIMKNRADVLMPWMRPSLGVLVLFPGFHPRRVCAICWRYDNRFFSRVSTVSSFLFRHSRQLCAVLWK